MRAVQFGRYGPPEVLEVCAAPTPTPRAGEVLVRVHGSSVNPFDARIRSGGYRLITGWRFPKGTGLDFAGEIAEVGSAVTDLAVGQRVWGFLYGLPGRVAAAAEYLAVKRSWVGPAPAGTDLVSAAALPTVGLTALRAVHHTLALRAGQRLLVRGASGGVGSATIQLGRSLGASVTALASARNAEFCRELGADEVFDYATTDPASLGRDFDAILDCHGAGLSPYRRLVRRGGRVATTASSAMGLAALSVALPGPRVRVVMARPSRAALAALADHVDRGDLRPVIDRAYPLDEIGDAHRAVESGHARGKRVVRLIDA